MLFTPDPDSPQYESYVIEKLAALLVNGFQPRIGEPFPIGWNLQRERVYALADGKRIHQARLLVAAWNRRAAAPPEAALEDAEPARRIKTLSASCLNCPYRRFGQRADTTS